MYRDVLDPQPLNGILNDIEELKQKETDIIPRLKANYEMMTQHELVEVMQREAFGEVRYYQDASPRSTVEIAEIACDDLDRTDSVLEFLGIDISQLRCKMDVSLCDYGYQEACYAVLGDEKGEDEDEIEKHEAEIEEVVKEYNEKIQKAVEDYCEANLKYLDVEYEANGLCYDNVDSSSLLDEKVQQIIDDLFDSDGYYGKKDEFLWLANMADCVYDKDPVAYFNRYLNQWKSDTETFIHDLEEARKQLDDIVNAIESEVDKYRDEIFDVVSCEIG